MARQLTPPVNELVRVLEDEPRGIGEHVGATVQVPAVSTRVSQVRFLPRLTPQEAADPDLVLDLVIEWLNPSTGLWQLAGGGRWQGGQRDRFGNILEPATTVWHAQLPGQQVRGVATPVQRGFTSLPADMALEQD